MVKLHEALVIPPPVPKPREKRWNCILDDGIGVVQTKEVCEMAGEFIDVWKIARVAALIFPERLIREKIQICRTYDIEVEPGGILFEIAVLQNSVEEFLDGVKEMGFTALELSENIITLSEKERLDLIKQTIDLGLTMLYEWGKKTPDKSFGVEDAAAEIKAALAAGSKKVVVERSEIDDLIGGDPEGLLRFVKLVGLDNIIFEAGPGKPDYPAWFIKTFGPDVNLGNIAVTPAGAGDSVFLVEMQRRGLDRRVGPYGFVKQGARLDIEWWK